MINEFALAAMNPIAYFRVFDLDAARLRCIIPPSCEPNQPFGDPLSLTAISLNFDFNHHTQ